MNEAFINDLRAHANHNRECIRGTSDREGASDAIKKVIAHADVVYELWVDPSAPNGLGMDIIKGRAVLQRIVANNEKEQVVCSAFWCADAGACEYMSLLCGDLSKMAA